jgi:hypothetical protein
VRGNQGDFTHILAVQPKSAHKLVVATLIPRRSRNFTLEQMLPRDLDAKIDEKHDQRGTNWIDKEERITV